MRFGVWGLGFWGLGFGVLGFGFWVLGFGFGVLGWGFGCRGFEDLGIFRVQGFNMQGVLGFGVCRVLMSAFNI